MLEIVAEQTGYPTDLLDMELDLEADLGIDTVKQAEVFAQIREAYGIERDDSMKLRDYPTLNHVVAFVLERAGVPAGAAPAPAAPAPAAPGHRPARRPAAAAAPAAAPPGRGSAAPATGDVEQRVLEIVAEQTGYPTDLLDMELDLEADLGIDTVKQAEVFAQIREAYGIERDDSLKLRDYPTLNHVVGFVLERAGVPAGAAPTPAAPAPAAPAPAQPPRPRPPRLRRPLRPPRPLRLRLRLRPPLGMLSSGCWRSWLSKRAIQPICWTWSSTWRQTWGSTRSSRQRCSLRSARPTGSSVTTR